MPRQILLSLAAISLIVPLSVLLESAPFSELLGRWSILQESCSTPEITLRFALSRTAVHTIHKPHPRAYVLQYPKHHPHAIACGHDRMHRANRQPLRLSTRLEAQDQLPQREDVRSTLPKSVPPRNEMLDKVH